MTALLEARLRGRDKLQSERSQRFMPLARSLAENADESAIITMLLDDYYQQTLHTPLPQPSDTPAAPAEKTKPFSPDRNRGGRPARRR